MTAFHECTGCFKIKPETDYGFSKNNGLRKKQCKACLADKSREYKRLLAQQLRDTKKQEAAKEKRDRKMINDLLRTPWVRA